MERDAATKSKIKRLLMESIVLMEAAEKKDLAEALKYITDHAPELLQVSMIGRVLIVVTSNYPFIQIDLDRKEVRIWEDWRERLLTKARENIKTLSRGLISTLLSTNWEKETKERIRKALEALDREEEQLEALKSLTTIFNV